MYHCTTLGLAIVVSTTSFPGSLLFTSQEVREGSEEERPGKRVDCSIDLCHAGHAESQENKKLSFARQTWPRREFSARLAMQKQSFNILLRLNMATE